MQQSSPYGGLASATVTLSETGQNHTVVLTPGATGNAARLTVSGLAAQTGRVWFAALSLRAGTPGLGLPEGEALGQVSIISDKAALALRTRAVQRDWMRFLWDTARLLDGYAGLHSGRPASEVPSDRNAISRFRNRLNLVD